MGVVTYDHIRKAINRKRFQDLFPELAEIFERYITRPGCGSCEETLFSALLASPERLKQYFGDDSQFEQIPPPPPALARMVPEQSFTVINCHVDELSSKLNMMPPGRYEIAAARWENEITVIVKTIA